MQTVHLPGDEPKPETSVGPERVPLVRLAGRSGGSPALTRAVAAGVVRGGPGRVAVAAFQSSV
ncbi:FxSxx-COOH cyclophane-containing RiPP peptide [Streptomyces ossamyceticus]|uniref:FxSxx-COOH cyclophane-containing RiPP peptide n=1 Tax=Streptomyces ossamyceticus TaxID=249581 RepID=UPI0036ED3678